MPVTVQKIILYQVCENSARNSKLGSSPRTITTERSSTFFHGNLELTLILELLYMCIVHIVVVVVVD